MPEQPPAGPPMRRSRAFIGSVNLLGQGADRVLVLLQIVVVAAAFGTSAEADLYFLAAIGPLTLGVVVGEPLGRATLALLVRAGRDEGRALAAAGLVAVAALVLAVTAAYLGLVLPLVAVVEPAGTGAAGPWIVFGLVAPILAFGTYLDSVLLWLEHYAWPALRLPIASAVGLVLLVPAGLVGGRVVWAAAAIAAGQLVALAVLYARTSALLGWDWPARLTRPALRQAFAVRRRALAPFLGGLLGGQVIVLLERVFAAGFGTGAVATVSYARGIASAPALVSQALGAGVYPGLVRAESAGALAYLRESFLGGLRLALYVGTAFAAFFALFGPAVAAFLLERGAFDPEEAQRTGEVLMAFAPATLATGLIFYLVAVLYGVGDFPAVLYRSLAVLAAYLLAAPALGRAFGAVGLALGFSLALVVGAVTALELARRRTELTWRVAVAEAVAPALGRAGLVVAALAAHRLLLEVVDVPVRWRGVVGVGGAGVILLVVGTLVLLRADLPEARRMRELARPLPRRDPPGPAPT